MDYRRIADYVRNARMGRWPNQADFAIACGLSERTIRYVESGEERRYSARTKARIEATLGWGPDGFEAVGRGGEPTDQELRRLQLVWDQIPQSVRRRLADLGESIARPR